MAPTSVNFGRSRRIERAEDEAAFRRGIDQIVQCQQNPKAFPGKHGTVVGKAEGTVQPKPGKLFFCPGADIILPALF